MAPFDTGDTLHSQNKDCLNQNEFPMKTGILPSKTFLLMASLDAGSEKAPQHFQFKI